MPEIIYKYRWISIKVVCEYLSIKRHTIMRWVEYHNMSTCKIGKPWGFKTVDIDLWVRNGGASNEREVIE